MVWGDKEVDAVVAEGGVAEGGDKGGDNFILLTEDVIEKMKVSILR